MEMFSQVSHYNIADLVFALYLLVYFPFDGIRRSLSVKSTKPELSVLQSYWRQGRFLLAIIAVFMLVIWLENHSANQLGLALPPSTAGIWGLVIAIGLLTTLHILGIRKEAQG